jgi:hypothetical protein
VGRQRIADVEDQGNGRWTVSIQQTVEGLLESGDLESPAAVAYHYFNVLEAATIDLRVDTVAGTAEGYPEMLIFRNDGSLTEDDFVVRANSEYFSIPSYGSAGAVFLSPGAYLVAIGTEYLEPSEAASGINIFCEHECIPAKLGAYQISVSTAPKIGLDKNLVGYFVDLDVSDSAGPYYEIIDVDDRNRLVVSSSDNLSSAVGNDLSGVHKIAALQIKGGATVDFGADKILLTSEDGLNIAPDSTLQAAGIVGLDVFPTVDFNLAISGNLAVDDLVIRDGNLTVGGQLDVTNNLSAAKLQQSVVLQADGIEVGGDAQFDGVTVISPSVAVYGNLTLTNGAVLTVPEADESSFYPLDIWVEQTLKIYGAAVDASGKGYPRGRTLGNQEYYISAAVGGSHAGIGGHGAAGSVDAYGDYLIADYPGSGGRDGSNYGAAGGGVVHIQAAALDLDQGAILADGGIGASVNDPTGAGGSIRIEASDFIQDTGMLSRITANGGGAWDAARYNTGAGGRVVVRYTNDLGFNKAYITAHGGPSPATGANLGAAGTVYLQQAGELGELKISNVDPFAGQTITSAQPTPVEALGRRTIESITDLGSNNWLIRVGGTLEPDRSYAGYLIDPDASDMDGPYYDILGVQDENGLLVYSENDLSFFVNGDLVGVHEIGKLQIEGGAFVDFGWDRILVPAANAIVLSSDITELQAGSFIGWENVVWPQGFNLLTLNGNSTVYEWRNSNITWNLMLNGELEVGQVMAVESRDAAITIQADAIYVGGDATFSGVSPGFVTVITPVLDVAGVEYFGPGSRYLPEIPKVFSEDFEDGNIDGWTTGGSANWFATTDDTHGGSYSACSGDIADYQTSWIRRTAEFSGTLTFWWKVSAGYYNNDYLEFHINGIRQARISGETSWQRQEYSVSEGDEIMWRYMKDDLWTKGLDKGWIDDIRIEE